MQSATDGSLNFYDLTGSTEAMRIDSSGNLLVGKTTTAIGTAGHRINGLGYHYATRAMGSNGTDPVFIANILNNDGNAIEIYKDSNKVGSIGVAAGDNLYIGSTAANHGGIYMNDSGVLPMSAGAVSNNTKDLGNPSFRWKDLYLSGGVYLGGTGSANKLEDYEEGTWTPTIAGTNNTPTYYNNYGKYTKVGRKVTIQFFQQTNSPPTFSNNNAVFRITGIPFTCDGSGYSGSQGSMNSQGFHFNGSSNNQFTSGQVAASVGNDGGLALSFSVTSSGGTRGQVISGAAASGYIIEATVTYFTTQ
jgi:hypothetical protein